MPGWLTGVFHAIAKVLAGGAAAAAAVTGAAPGPVATGSISAGMQSGPACIMAAIQPGGSATTNISVVNPANGYERLNPSKQTMLPAYQIGFAAPFSWVTLGSPGPHNWVGSHDTGIVHVTVNVPGGAKPGDYSELIAVNAGLGQTFGTKAGVTVALGAGAETVLVFRVGNGGALHKAFCTGRSPTWTPEPMNCRSGQQYALSHTEQAGRVAGRCNVLPPPPPLASLRTCRTPLQRAEYLMSLRAWHLHHWGTGPHCQNLAPGAYGAALELGNAAYYRFEEDVAGTLRPPAQMPAYR